MQNQKETKVFRSLDHTIHHKWYNIFDFTIPPPISNWNTLGTLIHNYIFTINTKIYFRHPNPFIQRINNKLTYHHNIKHKILIQNTIKKETKILRTKAVTISC